MIPDKRGYIFSTKLPVGCHNANTIQRLCSLIFVTVEKHPQTIAIVALYTDVNIYRTRTKSMPSMLRHSLQYCHLLEKDKTATVLQPELRSFTHEGRKLSTKVCIKLHATKKINTFSPISSGRNTVIRIFFKKCTCL